MKKEPIYEKVDETTFKKITEVEQVGKLEEVVQKRDHSQRVVDAFILELAQLDLEIDAIKAVGVKETKDIIVVEEIEEIEEIKL